MTSVIVLKARRLPADAEALAVCDVELDACLSVRGVEIRDDPVHGGQVALAPRRPWGDHERVLAWSPRVSATIVDEVKRALGDHTAVIGDAYPDSVARAVFGSARLLNGRPESEIPSAELPAAEGELDDEGDPDDQEPAPVPVYSGGTELAPARQRLVDVLRAEPGLTTAQLAERSGLAPSSVRTYIREAVVAGLVRSEPGGVTYWPAEDRDR